MKLLEPPDSFHLQAAQGWCELHSFIEADQELEKIAPHLRAHPSVLEVRWQIYANVGKWEGALDIAAALVKLVPHCSGGWIYHASSLTELKRHQEAYDTLIKAASKFPKEEIIPYDLACVCCTLNRVEEARGWFGKAVEVGGNEMRKRALNDPDLEPLWKSSEPQLPQ